ncbi:hypothetical protein HYG81_23350 (plasmid) [Natrinema zhouii]|uniref:hypothetical protein n=1 Tax=Natrinema zhouii TaxID=1710539 RepID=UPI001D00050E|nr:hypothetical protein [Natrinema zhouii]UHQ98814.1 hypothetical protein HYG81_23350 [Natrinema zhouii]
MPQITAVEYVPDDIEAKQPIRSRARYSRSLSVETFASERPPGVCLVDVSPISDGCEGELAVLMRAVMARLECDPLGPLRASAIPIRDRTAVKIRAKWRYWLRPDTIDGSPSSSP